MRTPHGSFESLSNQVSTVSDQQSQISITGLFETEKCKTVVEEGVSFVIEGVGMKEILRARD